LGPLRYVQSTVKAAAFVVALVTTHPLLADVIPGLWGVWHGKHTDHDIYLCIQADPEIAPYDDFAAIYSTADNQIELLDHDQFASGPWWSRNDKSLKATLTILTGASVKLDRNALDPWSGIKLEPIPFTKVDGINLPCGSPEFNQARAVMPPLQVTSLMLDGVPYDVITLVDPAGNGVVSTFQLSSDADGTDAINSWLRTFIPKTAKDAPYYSCTIEALSVGGGSVWKQRLFPEMISDNFVVVGDASEVYCGGPYPDTSIEWHVFDRRSGANIDTHNWFHPDAFNLLGPNAGVGPEIGDPEIEIGFRDLITSEFLAAHPDESCRDFLDEVNDWNVRPSKTGLIFQPEVAHISQACAVDLAIDFQDLTPFLTKSFPKINAD